MPAPIRSSTLGLAVLALLETGPLHPYGIQRRIKDWGKDKVVNVGQRANLYRTITRLQEAGLIAVRQTERDQQFPERTVYELTAEGRQVSREWVAELVATPRNEYPVFPAALSFLMLLAPDDAVRLLDERAGHLRGQVSELDHEMDEIGPQLPAIVLVETDYARTIARAELRWVTRTANAIRAGELSWKIEDFDPDLFDDGATD